MAEAGDAVHGPSGGDLNMQPPVELLLHVGYRDHALLQVAPL